MQKITLVAAFAHRYCIGINNRIPWHLPEDFQFFRNYTIGKPVIMGRKTWESLPRKPLPDRRNIIISRQTDYPAAGAEIMDSLTAALNACSKAPEIIIMGGAQIYTEAMPAATDLRITEVGLSVAGDAFFPKISSSDWQEISREAHTAANGTGYAFVHYERLR